MEACFIIRGRSGRKNIGAELTRDSKAVEECAMKFECPVIVLDGALPVTHNLIKMIDILNLSS